MFLEGGVRGELGPRYHRKSALYYAVLLKIRSGFFKLLTGNDPQKISKYLWFPNNKSYLLSIGTKKKILEIKLAANNNIKKRHSRFMWRMLS